MTPALVLVMAAGEGTRMRSALPKVLHPVCGRPMVAWPVAAARAAGAERVAVITSPGRDLSAALPAGAETVFQPQADGTGGAVRSAAELIEQTGEGSVVVLSGDVPLLSAEEISALIATHEGSGAEATVMTAILEQPGSYGRIVRDAEGRVERIVETKAAGDASAAELEIREVNAGIYVFGAAALLAALGQIDNRNAQGEYYLPDTLPAIRAAGGAVAAHVTDDPAVMLGVNNRADLALVEAEGRRRILNRLMLSGVTVTDPGSTWVDVEVEVGSDVTLLPGTLLRGATRVGDAATVGPQVTATDAVIGEGATVLHSVLSECEVGQDCSVGPFAYLRPGTVLQQGAKAGTFVEIKNSQVGPGAKVPHLAYVGDAEIGAQANLGAGTITANYDGFSKHRTVVGERARVGVDTALIAPVQVGADAYTGGGSVISKDVPPGALGISRADQRNIENFAERKAAMADKDGDQ